MEIDVKDIDFTQVGDYLYIVDVGQIYEYDLTNHKNIFNLPTEDIFKILNHNINDCMYWFSTTRCAIKYNKI